MVEQAEKAIHRRNWLIWGLLTLVMIFAAALRWTGLDWDDYQHFHPDERYIAWVATTIEWPSDLRSALNPTQSSFNPFYWSPDAVSRGIQVEQDRPRAFAYGHVPLYLGVVATRFVEKIAPALIPLLPQDWLVTADLLNGRSAIEFRHLTAVARALTGLVDLATIFVLFLLGKKLFSPAVGLLAAVLLAVNVLHIQNSHFFIVDPYLAFFTVTAVYLMVRSAAGRKAVGRKVDRNLLVAAVFVGLAVGAKVSAVMLILPLIVTVGLGGREKWVWRLGTAVLVAALTFILTNPFAVLDFGCEAISPALFLGSITIPALDWKSCYLENIFTQGAMVNGGADLGFTRQYANTWPYFYFIEMQLRWGMGWLLGLAAVAGFVWVCVQVARYFWALPFVEAEQGMSTAPNALLILLAWTIPFFLVTGVLYVKFMRYLLPLTPFLMLYAAAMLWSLRERVGRGVMGVVIVVVVVATAVYAMAFVNLYSTEHPWMAASKWVYANIPAGTLILSEQWDDYLPATMMVDGELRERAEYPNQELTWLTGADEFDDVEKLTANLQLLAEAEYLTVMSNRVYGVVPRLSERYPLSSQYHQLLFDGKLGYEPVFVNTRMPNILGFNFYPDSFGWPRLRPSSLVADYLTTFRGINGGRFDESFTVYDQPLVIIYKNSEKLTAAEMELLFDLQN